MTSLVASPPEESVNRQNNKKTRYQVIVEKIIIISLFPIKERYNCGHSRYSHNKAQRYSHINPNRRPRRMPDHNLIVLCIKSTVHFSNDWLQC